MSKTFDLFNMPSDDHKGFKDPSAVSGFSPITADTKVELEKDTWYAYIAGIVESRGVLTWNYENCLDFFRLTIWYGGSENAYPLPCKVKDYLKNFGEEKREEYIVIKEVDSLVAFLRFIEPYAYRKNYKVLNLMVKLQEVKRELNKLSSSDDMEILEG